MGHSIQAFIASKEALVNATSDYNCIVIKDLPQNLAILPVTKDAFNEIVAREQETTGLSDERFLYLTPKLADLGLRISSDSSVAYVETDYFGGVGYQCAIVWCRNEVIFGPYATGREIGFQMDNIEGRAINNALIKLGVQKGAYLDEFEAIGLGKHRDTDSWLS